MNSWRLGELVAGQLRAVDFLERWAGTETQSPLIFAGPPGVGKRTAALVCAQAVNCTEDSARPCGVCRNCTSIAQLTHPDVVLLFPIRMPPSTPKEREIEVAADVTRGRYADYTMALPQPEPNRKFFVPVPAIHWVRRETARPPALGRRRLFIILHAHQMTKEASNALLKMLEEPQGHTTFILTTDNPGFVLDTIRSRCQTVRFSPIPEELVANWLRDNADTSEADAELAAGLAGGSIGDAMRFLADREAFLVEPVVDYFAGRTGSDEQAILETMDRLREVPPAAVVATLLFLYRQALLVKLGRESGFARLRPADMKRALGTDTNYLRRAVRFLIERSRESGTNVNARLFNFTLLTMLRRAKA